MSEIDLSRLTKQKVTMLTGQQRGVSARELYRLDELDQKPDKVVVVAPDDLDTITPSFVQGFLAASLSRLGANELRKKYDMSNLPKMLQTDFQTGIERLLLHERSDAVHS